MQIKKDQRNIFHITLTGYELATLISSARWISDGAEGALTDEAMSNLKQFLENYDTATATLFNNTSS